jgi:hypothetical protein
LRRSYAISGATNHFLLIIAPDVARTSSQQGENN